MSNRKEIRVSIVQSDPTELSIANYMVNARRSIKHLSITPWTAYYGALAAIDAGMDRAEILEAARESISQLRAQIDNIGMALEVHGLEIPSGVYPKISGVNAGKTSKRRSSKSHTVQIEDADNDFLDDTEDELPIKHPQRTMIIEDKEIQE